MKTHDFTNPSWGHNITVVRQDARTADIVGWCDGVESGDALLLPGTACTLRYYVREVSYFSNPPDMFKASIVRAELPVAEGSKPA